MKLLGLILILGAGLATAAAEEFVIDWHAFDGGGANAASTTHPVEQRFGNPWGLSDLQGNVWECCQGRFGVYPGGVVGDPSGPSNDTQRVIRGGTWNASADGCCSASRTALNPGAGRNDVGFRPVLAPN